MVIEAVQAGDERATLEGFLDDYRAEVVRKIRGMSEAQARRRLVPSLTTLAGLVKHLTVVEESWFLRRTGGRDDLPPRIPTDEEFTPAASDTVDSLVEAYEQMCAAARTEAAKHDLDDLITHERGGQMSLRWIFVHMIEETARHAGHMDILREQLEAEG